MDRLESFLRRVWSWVSELWPSWFPPGLPGWWTAVLFGVALGTVIGVLLGPRLNIARWRLGLWLAVMLSVPAATWTVPTHAARFEAVLRGCTQGQLPRPSMLTSGFTTEVVSNIAMTVPIGAAAVLWPMGARRLAALCVALATPPLIETVQLIPVLRRGCQLGDVVNNSIGVLVGFALAAGVEAVVVSWRRAHEATGVREAASVDTDTDVSVRAGRGGQMPPRQ